MLSNHDTIVDLGDSAPWADAELDDQVGLPCNFASEKHFEICQAEEERGLCQDRSEFKSWCSHGTSLSLIFSQLENGRMYYPFLVGWGSRGVGVGADRVGPKFWAAAKSSYSLVS